MIIDKQPLPDDPTPSEAPPSYDGLEGVPGRPLRDTKAISPILAPHHHAPLPPIPSSSSLSPPPSLSKSPSSSSQSPSSPSQSNSKGKARAPNSWFNFNASRTTREVRTTVLGLVRDLVREQDPNARAALGILESCAEACSGYALSLPALLQERSIEGHSPLYWAIVKRPPDPDSDSPNPLPSNNLNSDFNTGDGAIPDLLTALISYASPLTPDTIADVRHACLLTSDQLLFQRLRMSPEFAPLSGTDEMLLGARIPPDGIAVEDVPGDEGAFAVHFEVVHFRKRMLVSGHIELDFIARARMWRLEFSIAQDGQRDGPRPGSWYISLSLLQNSPPTWVDSRLLIPEPPPSPSASEAPLSPSHSTSPISIPSIFERTKPKPKPKPTITIRLKSPQQLVAPSGGRGRAPAIVVSLEDSMMGSSLQYAGTSYIAPDETLRARLEARLGRAGIVDSECVIC